MRRAEYVRVGIVAALIGGASGYIVSELNKSAPTVIVEREGSVLADIVDRNLLTNKRLSDTNFSLGQMRKTVLEQGKDIEALKKK